MPRESQLASARLLPALEPGKLRATSARDYALRFALGAIISVSAQIISTTVGARFGGMFLAFPAILPASLTLVQAKEGTGPADRNAIGAVLGSIGMAAFAMVGELAITRIEPYAALGLALLAWIITSVALYALFAVLQPSEV